MPNWKTYLPFAPVALVDTTTSINVYSTYKYFDPVAAALVAVGFVVLQIACLVFAALSQRPATRRRLFYGAVLLLAITGAANVAQGYLHAARSMPADKLAPVFGFGSHGAAFTVAAAWITGLALVIVATILWGAAGEYLQSVRKQSEETQRQLEQLLRGERG